ncbi:malonyl-CoA decarboxylase [Candidatus Mesenet endosymbiont of Phosphuga atrata]|uniref:malonyl-CoA decarboxylase n=1 Tax=Candidatus Mesenet endosymbiont of Phosphuga atrata TaxID=3066221 RepID=UPI0030D62774
MTDQHFTKIKRNAIASILRALGEATETVRSWVGSISEDLTGNKDIEALKMKMQECLNPKGGEVTARRNTVSLGNLYLNLSEVGKVRFLKILVEEFSANKKEINDKITAYQTNSDPKSSYKLEQELITSLESPRLKILKQFISLENGLKFIVDMRSDALKLKSEHKILSTLEKDLKNILSSWFDVELLDFCQITWDSSASLLEKLIKYEAVHKITSWDDLKNRLGLCFAFFHYKIPNEPLIFVEIALTDEIANNIQSLLDESIPATDPKSMNTAMFYSISNTQAGLSGINLGNFLIKRVVERLSQEFKNIKTYATLSPMPSFTKWLSNVPKPEQLAQKLKIDKPISEVLEYINLPQIQNCPDDIKQIILKLCAHYLLKVKNEKSNSAFDPVAHFHLSNGASIKRLNWLADTSEKGINQSFGIMVNYLYELSKIDHNHENYMINKIMSSTKDVSSLLSK